MSFGPYFDELYEQTGIPSNQRYQSPRSGLQSRTQDNLTENILFLKNSNANHKTQDERTPSFNSV